MQTAKETFSTHPSEVDVLLKGSLRCFSRVFTLPANIPYQDLSNEVHARVIQAAQSSRPLNLLLNHLNYSQNFPKLFKSMRWS